MSKSPFNRGYSEVREKIGKGSKYTMSCFNCEHYYQTEEDEKETCQNPKVLRYDMVITENNIYCNLWEMSYRKVTAKSLFRKEKKK